MSGGKRPLWIFTGVFLIMCSLVVVSLPNALPVAVCLPAIYCIFSERFTSLHPLGVAALPLVLMVAPQFFTGGLIYASLLVCGIMMCRFVRTGHPTLAVSAPSAFILALLAINIMVHAAHRGVGPGEIINVWVGKMLSEAAGMYEGVMSAGNLQEFKMNLPALKLRIVTVFPAMVGSTVVFCMWINLLIISRSKNGLNLMQWRCPDWVVAFFILAGVCTLLPYATLRAAGLNLLIMIIQIYFFQGIAIVSFFMAEHSWVRFVRWTIYILIVTQVYIMITVSTIGLFDTWFNFRERIRNAPKGEEQ
ncbi:MAG: DUF2232 domain-containing protein [Desulfomonilia bacterium]